MLGQCDMGVVSHSGLGLMGILNRKDEEIKLLQKQNEKIKLINKSLT